MIRCVVLAQPSYEAIMCGDEPTLTAYRDIEQRLQPTDHTTSELVWQPAHWPSLLAACTLTLTAGSLHTDPHCWRPAHWPSLLAACTLTLTAGGLHCDPHCWRPAHWPSLLAACTLALTTGSLHTGPHCWRPAHWPSLLAACTLTLTAGGLLTGPHCSVQAVHLLVRQGTTLTRLEWYTHNVYKITRVVHTRCIQDY